MIIHPHPNPVAFEVFGFGVHWYGLMYLAGFALAWAMGRHLLRQQNFTSLHGLVMEDFIVAAVLGVVLGGRLGYVLFYQPAHFLAQPQEIALLWRGGMAFHGGLIGVIVSLWVLAYVHARRHSAVSLRTAFLRLLDFAAVLTPPGLGLGRLGNFINAELPGRVASAELPWAVVFGVPDDLPRHPSQLYQMGVEGVLLTLLMWGLSRRAHAPGWLGAAFISAYALGRFAMEFFREPDSHLGLLFLQLSMGQWLSLPMFLLGIAMMYHLRLPPSERKHQ